MVGRRGFINLPYKFLEVQPNKRLAAVVLLICLINSQKFDQTSGDISGISNRPINHSRYIIRQIISAPYLFYRKS
jgi:hypothetical protein